MTDWTSIYRNIALARVFELATAQLWNDGKISGEIHLGTGEEVLYAAVISQLRPDDAMAIDHRASPAFVMRGVDLEALFAEMLGEEAGLCRGMGGHMHFFNADPITTSSGIVGASGPAAVGYALSGRYLRPKSVSVAMFGDGAANQGMLLESMNLAAAWELPVVFVCKDNGWAITTRTADVTGGNLTTRAESFGLRVWDVDGGDMQGTLDVMHGAVRHARRRGPVFVRAAVPRLQGHFLGYKAGRIADHPVSEEAVEQVRAGVHGLRGKGGSLLSRTGGLLTQMKTLLRSRGETLGRPDDPLIRAQCRAEAIGVDVENIDLEVAREVEMAANRALDAHGGPK